MLYLIGLGLAWKDVSMNALEAISKCSKVYLESYTSVSDFTVEKLSRLIGKPIHPLDRKQVEEDLVFLGNADASDIALLVYGDVLAATTHFEILKQAKKRNIQIQIIHAPSILTVVSETGLSLYRFGKTTSIPMSEENFKPTSFFEVLEENQTINAHTLFLLDLKPKQNKFLTIKQAIQTLLDIAKQKNSKLFTEETFVVACARLGQQDQIIKAGKAKEVMKKDFSNAPYCLIVPAKLNDKETEYLN